MSMNALTICDGEAYFHCRSCHVFKKMATMVLTKPSLHVIEIHSKGFYNEWGGEEQSPCSRNNRYIILIQQ